MKNNILGVKKLFTIGAIAVTCAFSNVESGIAELINRGGGLIYDTKLDITWLQQGSFGQAYWTNAMSFADKFVYQGYDDWRLPETDALGIKKCRNSKNYNNCKGDELGHLLFFDHINHKNPGVFDSIGFNTWYSNNSIRNNHRTFNMNRSHNHTTHKNKYRGDIMLVRDGDSVPIAPEPVSSTLFLAGGGVLAGRKFYKRFRKR